MKSSPIHFFAALLSVCAPPCIGDVVNIDFGTVNSVTYSGQGPFMDRTGNTLFDPPANFWNGISPPNAANPQATPTAILQSDGATPTTVEIDFVNSPADLAADRPDNAYAAADAKELMQDFLVATTSFQWIYLKGLTPLSKYLLFLYAAGDNPLLGTNFTIGGMQSGTTTGTTGPILDTPHLTAKEDYVMRTATTDQMGRILISYNTLSGEGAFNGLQIVGAFPEGESPPASQMLFTSELPDAPDVSDARPYALGMKFMTAKNGRIMAIRFWKSPSEVGLHTGRIWSASGSLLASVEFTAENSSGWQSADLAPPLEVSSGEHYIVSVNANSHFPMTLSGLANQVVTGDLSTVLGEAGLFGDVGQFPSGSFQDSNYFRDVVFVANP